MGGGDDKNESEKESAHYGHDFADTCAHYRSCIKPQLPVSSTGSAAIQGEARTVYEFHDRELASLKRLPHVVPGMMSRTTVQIIFFAYLGWGVLLQGCSSLPPVQPAVVPPIVQPSAPPLSAGNEIAMRAISLLGAPYKWGGSGPTQFDCSGLVRFVYSEIGVEVPRTAAEQFSAARRLRLNEIAPGDLLFFRISGRRISHVAIYAGEGRFIHAPQTGRPVELRMMDDEFYRPRLVAAGRFL